MRLIPPRGMAAPAAHDHGRHHGTTRWPPDGCGAGRTPRPGSPVLLSVGVISHRPDACPFGMAVQAEPTDRLQVLMTFASCTMRPNAWPMPTSRNRLSLLCGSGAFLRSAGSMAVCGSWLLATSFNAWPAVCRGLSGSLPPYQSGLSRQARHRGIVQNAPHDSSVGPCWTLRPCSILSPAAVSEVTPGLAARNWRILASGDGGLGASGANIDTAGPPILVGCPQKLLRGGTHAAASCFGCP